MIRVGPIGISTSLGIFQYHLPSKKPIIPYGMNCLYCCQFDIVILVPGGILAASWITLEAIPGGVFVRLCMSQPHERPCGQNEKKNDQLAYYSHGPLPPC